MVGELPLHRFFLDLRKQTGLSLAPSHLADLQRLILEIHPQGPEEMLAICRILWLQKAETSEIFDRLFWQNWGQLEESFAKAVMNEDRKLETPPIENPIQDKKPYNQSEEPNPQNDNNSEKDESQDKIPPPKEGEEQNNESLEQSRSIWFQFDEFIDKNKKEFGRSPKTDPTFLDHSFVFVPKYWPIPYRRLQQNWRYLRNEHQKTTKESIDIKKTVEKISTERIIDHPEYELEYSSIGQDLYVLLDNGSSMTPFAELSAFLLKSIVDALKPRKLKTFFFKNHPEDKLYQDEGYLVNNWIKSIHKYSFVVIISDAGAIGNELEPHRIKKTQKFLKNIKLRTDRILWLNPLPRERWFGNSAFYISLFVAMVGTNTKDLKRLSNILKKL